jgi:hypothetical protein
MVSITYFIRPFSSMAGPTPITDPELYSSQEGSIAPIWTQAFSIMSLRPASLTRPSALDLAGSAL